VPGRQVLYGEQITHTTTISADAADAAAVVVLWLWQHQMLS
jgi:hypothetical protein